MADPVQRILLDERRRQVQARVKPRDANQEKVNKWLSKDPRGLELRYNAKLQRLQTEINKDIKRQLDGQRAFLLPANTDATTNFFEGLTKSVLAYLSLELPNIINTQALGIEAFNFKKYDRLLFDILGLNLLPTDISSNMLKSWVAENTQLITGANTKQLSQLGTTILRAVRSGQRVSDLTKDINKIFKGTRSNIKLIAEDQTNKLDGQLDRVKQMNAGIDMFIWLTQRDGRVRQKHKALDGLAFSWKTGADGIFPKQEIRCRCSASISLTNVI